MMIISRVNNQNNDEMSLRSQRTRVKFSEEIEMDSLEHENCVIAAGLGLLGTIQENDSFGQDNEDDVNLNDFHEFDVSVREILKCHQYGKYTLHICDML
jgi:hypothetical protein